MFISLKIPGNGYYVKLVPTMKKRSKEGRFQLRPGKLCPFGLINQHLLGTDNAKVIILVGASSGIGKHLSSVLTKPLVLVAELTCRWRFKGAALAKEYSSGKQAVK